MTTRVAFGFSRHSRTSFGPSSRCEQVRVLAESATKIGAILRYAFQRNPDGSPSETLSSPDRMPGCLGSWFDEQRASDK